MDEGSSYTLDWAVSLFISEQMAHESLAITMKLIVDCYFATYLQVKAVISIDT